MQLVVLLKPHTTTKWPWYSGFLQKHFWPTGRKQQYLTGEEQSSHVKMTALTSTIATWPCSRWDWISWTVTELLKDNQTVYIVQNKSWWIVKTNNHCQKLTISSPSHLCSLLSGRGHSLCLLLCQSVSYKKTENHNQKATTSHSGKSKHVNLVKTAFCKVPDS